MTLYGIGEPIEGAGAQIRYVRVPKTGPLARPVDNTGFKTITGVTTSELKGNQDTKDLPRDYESDPNAAWKDSRPGARGWSFTMSANKKNQTEQAAMLQELWDIWAAGDYVWIERLLPEDTHWRGGLGYLTDPTEPAPADGIVTFSSGVTGKGELTKVAKAA